MTYKCYTCFEKFLIPVEYSVKRCPYCLSTDIHLIENVAVHNKPKEES